MREVGIDEAAALVRTVPQGPVQVHVCVDGELDPTEIEKAWQGALLALIREREIEVNGEHSHAKFHTNGKGNGNGNGNGNGHSVTPKARIVWQQHDLRGLNLEEARTWINFFLRTDQVQTISDERPWKIRCALLRTDERACELVCSFHPLLRQHIDPEQVTAAFAAAYPFPFHVSDAPQATIPDRAPAPPVQNAKLANKKSKPVSRTPLTDSDDDFVDPRLKSIWQTVLNTKAIKPDDDFFDLGGHSLLAARLLARIEDATGIDLPLASLLESPTLRQQSRLLREYEGAESKDVSTATRQLPFFFLGGDPTFRPFSQKLGERREFHSLGLRMSVLAKLEKPDSLKCIATRSEERRVGKE